MDFESTFDARLIERLGKRRQEAEDIWKEILIFTNEEKVGVLLKNYTDHGWKHISKVVNTSWNLASDFAQDQLTEDEVFYLFGAGCYHDLGMHLDMQRLRILTDNSRCILSHNSSFKDKPWKDEWSEFRSILPTYRNEKLRGVFGRDDMTEAEILRATDINIDSLENWSAAGEFVRIHHARIAFEFAFCGLPRLDRIQEPLIKNDIDSELVGEIARSHGSALRDWVKFYHLNGGKPRACPHIFFLMALLRVGDYLQIGKDRAQDSIRIYWSPGNPVSDLEWDINRAVGKTEIDDLGRITFVMEGRKIPTLRHFQRLKNYFDDLSREFDMSFGVLIDQHPELVRGEFPFRYRRIESDLEHERVTMKFPFLPVDSRLKISGHDLVQLLIGPLYGFRGEVAIRELQQNALDAVEMRTVKTSAKHEYYAVESDIETVVSKDYKSIIVRDKGVGMSLDEIMGKLLVVGSTIKVKSEKNAVLQSGGSLRGKFGVGLLSLFMLSRRITIKTRSVAANEPGYKISLNAGDLNSVEITKSDDDRFGTEVCLEDLALFSDEENEFGNNHKIHRWHWLAGGLSDSTVWVEGKKIENRNSFPQRLLSPEFPIRRVFKGDLTIDYDHRKSGIWLNGVFVSYLDDDSILHFDPFGVNVWDINNDIDINLQRDSIKSISDIINVCRKYDQILFTVLLILMEDINKDILHSIFEKFITCHDTFIVLIEDDVEHFIVGFAHIQETVRSGAECWRVKNGREGVLRCDSFREERTKMLVIGKWSWTDGSLMKLKKGRTRDESFIGGEHIFIVDEESIKSVEKNLEQRYMNYNEFLLKHRKEVEFWRNSDLRIGWWLDDFGWAYNDIVKPI